MKKTITKKKEKERKGPTHFTPIEEVLMISM